MNTTSPQRADDELQQTALFLLEYASAQLAAGGQTLRVARTLDRLAKCFGYVCHATFLSRHVTMTLSQTGMMPVTLVGTVPNMGLNFRQLVALNNLSWLAHDRNLSFAEVRGRFGSIMAMRRYHPGFVLLAASIANASFCRLFGGDCIAMLLVFAGTIIALGLRQFMDKRHAAPCLSFMISSFIASIFVAAGTLTDITDTPQVAIGSSVLFLIPGVPMINSTLDLLTVFPLMAFSRLVRSCMLVSCIGLGLGCTLFITGLEMEPVVRLNAGANLCLDLCLDAFLAALASMGFAILSNPGAFVIVAGGFLAAVGHALRLYLLLTMQTGIISASLISALVIGVLCVILAKRFHIPGEFFSFLALLPMIPGMYAYDVILSTINFMNTSAVMEATPYLVTLIKDFLTVMFILCAMALGAITPLLVQHLFSDSEKYRQKLYANGKQYS